MKILAFERKQINWRTSYHQKSRNQSSKAYSTALQGKPTTAETTLYLFIAFKAAKEMRGTMRARQFLLALCFESRTQRIDFTWECWDGKVCSWAAPHVVYSFSSCCFCFFSAPSRDRFACAWPAKEEKRLHYKSLQTFV